MELKEVSVNITKDISEGVADLLYALTLTIRQENPSDVMMLQREAIMIFHRMGSEEIKAFFEFMQDLHRPFCTATETQMDSGHIEFDMRGSDHIGETVVEWLREDYPGQYL